jgi:hypothetical protein
VAPSGANACAVPVVPQQTAAANTNQKPRVVGVEAEFIFTKILFTFAVATDVNRLHSTSGKEKAISKRMHECLKQGVACGKMK